MKVIKAGGGVLFDNEAIAGLPDILAHVQMPYVLVVSAFGKTTNALECVATTALEGDDDGAAKILQETLSWHEDLARGLGVWNAAFVDSRAARSALRGAREAARTARRRAAFRDEILSFGEQWSSRIIAAFLRRRGLPVHLIEARDVVVTDTAFGAADPIQPITENRIQAAMKRPVRAGEISVIAGFVGATRQRTPTTLGREGSDYTAALVAAALGAEELVLLKSVDGVMSADPALVPSARVIASLSFDQAERLFNAGAKVVHPKTVGPVREKGISLHVKRFGSTSRGTVMSSSGMLEPGALHAVVARSTGESWQTGPPLPSLPASSDPQMTGDGLVCLTVVGEPPFEARTAAMVETSLRDVGSHAIQHDPTLFAWHGWVSSANVPRAPCRLHDRLCLRRSKGNESDD